MKNIIDPNDVYNHVQASKLKITTIRRTEITMDHYRKHHCSRHYYCSYTYNGTALSLTRETRNNEIRVPADWGQVERGAPYTR